MPTTGSARRYYLGKRRQAAEQSDTALEAVWQGKQEAEAGTPLPDDFPHLSTLAALGYETSEDLDGADSDELLSAGLTRRQAEAVLAALADL